MVEIWSLFSLFISRRCFPNHVGGGMEVEEEAEEQEMEKMVGRMLYVL